ncbi:hypothetical protein BH11ARM2_BH11ARM2_10750 [soil metagenome]
MRSAWAAVRHNLRPFLLIQAAALVFVALFSPWPAFAQTANRAGEIKAAAGPLGAMLATAFASVALPEAAKRLTRAAGIPKGEILFQIAVFMILGGMVDTLYRTLAVVVGNENDLRTVATKTALDMGLFAPLLAVPYSVLAFLWRDAGFSFARLRGMVRTELWPRYSAVLVTAWCFWIPVVIGLYSLPAGIQFVLYLCTQAAWSLLLVWMSSSDQTVPPLEEELGASR